MARYDDLHTGSIGYTTFVGSVLLLVIILLLRALTYYWLETEDQRKLADTHYTESDATIAAQHQRVSSYEKVSVELAADPAAGEDAKPTTIQLIHIPVDDAGKLLLKELSGDDA